MSPPLPREGDIVGRPVGGAAGGATLHAHGGRAGGAGCDGELRDGCVGAGGGAVVRGHPEDGAVRSSERGGLGPGGKVEADGGQGAGGVAVGDADAGEGKGAIDKLLDGDEGPLSSPNARLRAATTALVAAAMTASVSSAVAGDTDNIEAALQRKYGYIAPVSTSAMVAGIRSGVGFYRRRRHLREHLARLDLAAELHLQ